MGNDAQPLTLRIAGLRHRFDLARYGQLPAAGLGTAERLHSEDVPPL